MYFLSADLIYHKKLKKKSIPGSMGIYGVWSGPILLANGRAF